MKIYSGIDLVDVARFTRALNEGGEAFAKRIFLSSERDNMNPQHLAGIFAAKEAVVKAFSLEREAWQSIEIAYLPSGKPRVVLHLVLPFEVLSADVSIAHDAGIAVASFTALVS